MAAFAAPIKPDPGTDPQSEPDTQDLGEELGREVRALLEEMFAGLPKPEAALAPVVNVAPSPVAVNVPAQAAPVVEVNVPQGAAPVVNVETTAPIINVAPAINIHQGTTLEVQASAPTVNVAPSAALVELNQEDVARAIEGSSEVTRGLVASLIKSIDANTAAIKEQTQAIKAPKSLVMEGGKPVGVKTGS